MLMDIFYALRLLVVFQLLCPNSNFEQKRSDRLDTATIHRLHLLGRVERLYQYVTFNRLKNKIKKLLSTSQMYRSYYTHSRKKLQNSPLASVLFTAEQK